MMTEELALKIVAWHRENGGHPGSAKGHALRMLREVVELCIACGATTRDVNTAIQEECIKAIQKNEMKGTFTQENVNEEFADVSILLAVFEKYYIPQHEAYGAIAEKFGRCLVRDWEADKDGVLWRPGHSGGGGLVGRRLEGESS